MKNIFLIVIILITLSSCDNKTHNIEDDFQFEVFVQVTYKDNSIDTLSRVYQDMGDGMLKGSPSVKLTDEGCLQLGYESLMFRSMSNVACEVKTFKPLYLITKNNDTIR
tara:strand:+ start:796 stop:1122 length:327 start_codon:yes stop_codon:yes gene_type:complete